MTAHDPLQFKPFAEIRSWFRGGVARETADPALATRPLEGDPGEDTENRDRQQLLGQISDFLTTHRLPITRQTLLAAFDLAAGANPELAGSVALRMRARQAVTAEWLESALGAETAAADYAALHEVIERLEASVSEFSKTAHSARSATSEYGTALARHADELTAIDLPGVVISELAAVTRAMLGRTREVERALDRSEREGRALRARLDQERRSAEEDHLTGLPNRRAFEALFERELREALEAGEHLSVAFCDIDEFKRINDTHGHEAGDRILRVVAEALARISSDRCHVARHGGEEFVVLFRGISLDAAWGKLDKTREELSRRRLVNRASDQPFGQITFSGGIADVLAFADRRAALRAADVALYRAKQAGRNTILRATSGDAQLIS